MLYTGVTLFLKYEANLKAELLQAAVSKND